MKNPCKFLLIVLGLLIAVSSGCKHQADKSPENTGDTNDTDTTDNTNVPETTESTSTIPKAFVRRNNDKLVVGETDQVIYLRGVNLSYDRVATDNPADDWLIADYTDTGTPITSWYQEKHFQTMQEIGFNVARLNLSYRVFEDNAAPGSFKASAWTLLDQLIAWGKTYGIYLIIDMHVAPGGAGIISCAGCGYRTWDDNTYQTRFKALWRAIAERYANEPQIAAFDLLNEPAPTQSASQWKTLAQALIDDIRTVDKNHLVIVEMVNWLFDRNDQSTLADFDTSVLSNFQFLVNDDNAIYDYHYYLPRNYTLQDELNIDGGAYPDIGVNELSISGNTMQRNKAYLENEMSIVNAFWKTNNVPINYGEWGTATSALAAGNDKGGAQYLTDMMELMKANNVNWQFYFFNKIYQVDCCYDDNPTSLINPDIVNAIKAHFGK